MRRKLAANLDNIAIDLGEATAGPPPPVLACRSLPRFGVARAIEARSCPGSSRASTS